jgi:hypothetical protein
MAKSFTEAFTLNNAWKNLGVQARADGYTGSSVIKCGVVQNNNATVAYVHATENGATNPSTAADGMPIGTTSSTAPNGASIVLDEGTDIDTTWIHTAGNQTIKYSITGK